MGKNKEEKTNENTEYVDVHIKFHKRTVGGQVAFLIGAGLIFLFSKNAAMDAVLLFAMFLDVLALLMGRSKKISAEEPTQVASTPTTEEQSQAQPQKDTAQQQSTVKTKPKPLMEKESAQQQQVAEQGFMTPEEPKQETEMEDTEFTDDQWKKFFEEM